MDQATLGVWERLGPKAQQKLREYNLRLIDAAAELERLRLRRGVTLDEALNDPDARPVVAAFVSEVPGLVHFVLDQVLPIVSGELRPHLALSHLPPDYTKLVLGTIMGPSGTTSNGQCDILERVQHFGERLLLGEQSNN